MLIVAVFGTEDGDVETRNAGVRIIVLLDACSSRWFTRWTSSSEILVADAGTFRSFEELDCQAIDRWF